MLAGCIVLHVCATHVLCVQHSCCLVVLIVRCVCGTVCRHVWMFRELNELSLSIPDNCDDRSAEEGEQNAVVQRMEGVGGSLSQAPVFVAMPPTYGLDLMVKLQLGSQRQSIPVLSRFSKSLATYCVEADKGA